MRTGVTGKRGPSVNNQSFNTAEYYPETKMNPYGSYLAKKGKLAMAKPIAAKSTKNTFTGRVILLNLREYLGIGAWPWPPFSVDYGHEEKTYKRVMKTYW
jgi:hypothetical protein